MAAWSLGLGFVNRKFHRRLKDFARFFVSTEVKRQKIKNRYEGQSRIYVRCRSGFLLVEFTKIRCSNTRRGGLESLFNDQKEMNLDIAEGYKISDLLLVMKN